MKTNFPIAKLGDHVRHISLRNKDEFGIEVFSVTNSEGFTRSTDYFSKEVFSKNISNYKVVRKGQFAYNPSRINVGSIDYLRLAEKALVSPLYVVFETRSTLSSDYLLRYMKGDWGNAQIRANTVGAVRNSLKYKGLENIRIPLPALDDQERIAHLLARVEGLISRRKQHLQQLADLLESVFLEMFGDPAQNEKGWDKPDFETIAYGMRNGLSPSKAGGYKGRVYTLSAITGDYFREIFKEDVFSQIPDKYLPTDCDFLVCRGNGNISMVGKGYFFPGTSDEVIFPDTIIAVSIQPNTVNKQFFEALWKTRFMRQQIENKARTANGTYKINQGGIAKLKIILPPADLQNQFAKVVRKVERVKSYYQQSLKDLENLFGALSQKAFRGELDLSRVGCPCKGSDIVEEETDSEESQRMKPVFELPAPHDPAVLRSAKGRKVLLNAWMDAWVQQLGYAPFSAQGFMDAAQQRFWELAEDDALVGWAVPEYNELKNWVFEALSQGRLHQNYDSSHNRLQLTDAKG